MLDQDSNPNESIEVKKPFFQDVRNQRLVVLVVLVLSFAGLVAATQRDQLVQLNSEENDIAVKMEEVGFSYAYGTEPTDLGNEIEGFEPASEAEINELVSAVENSEDFIDEEGQDLFELLEYDEWNNEGSIDRSIVNELISAAGGEN